MSTKVRRLERYPAWGAMIVGLSVFLARYASPRPSFEVHRNLFFTGLVIIIVAFATVIANEGEASWNYWSLINVAAGVWLVASATLIPAISVVSAAQTILGALLSVIALTTSVMEFAYHRMRANERKRKSY